LDDDLRRRGLAREVIRHVQEHRKALGLEVSDWIYLFLEGLDDLESQFDAIGREVLAHSVTAGPPATGDQGVHLELDDGESVRHARIWVAKA
jgi:isoleucyl-tRNA synthetase